MSPKAVSNQMKNVKFASVEQDKRKRKRFRTEFRKIKIVRNIIIEAENSRVGKVGQTESQVSAKEIEENDNVMKYKIDAQI